MEALVTCFPHISSLPPILWEWGLVLSLRVEKARRTAVFPLPIAHPTISHGLVL